MRDKKTIQPNLEVQPNLEKFISGYDTFDTLSPESLSPESHIKSARIMKCFPFLRELSFPEIRKFIAQKVYDLVQKHSLPERHIPYTFFYTRELPAFIDSIITTYDLTRFIANEKRILFKEVLAEIVKPAKIKLMDTDKNKTRDTDKNDLGLLVGVINSIGVRCPEVKELYLELTFGERVVGCGTVPFGKKLMDYASAQGIKPRFPFTISDVSSITQYPKIPKEN